MAEVTREPYCVEVEGEFLVAFDEDHSLADIARWIMQNRGEAEDLHMILGQMLDGTYGEPVH